MGNIVVVMPRQEDANRVGDIIKRSDIWEEVVVCSTGADVLRLAVEQDICVVIGTKKYKDMGYEEMVGYLPAGVKMLLLTKDSSLVPFTDLVVKVMMPFSGSDLISTLRMMLPSSSGVRKRKPAKRSAEDQKIIDDAKMLLMERNGMTEPEAFRFIQKASMDTRRTMLESAQMILATDG